MRNNPWVKQRRLGTPPSFSICENVTTGTEYLSPDLTINSITVSPTARFVGRDAGASTWPAWKYGSSLAITGTGTAPTLGEDTPLIGSDLGVMAPGAGTNKYYQSTSTTFTDITTEDMVIEAVIRTGPLTSTGQLISKRLASGGAGWVLSVNNVPNVVLLIHDGTNTASLTSNTLSAQTWYHVLIFVDRSGSGQIYINGLANGSAVAVSTVNSITNTNKLTFCASPEGTSGSDDTIAYFALWSGAGWLNSHTQTNLAADRFTQLCGVYPWRSKGTKTPVAFTRTQPAYLDKLESGVRSLHRVGANWMRVVKRQDNNGAEIVGYFGESAISNLLLQSETFGTAPWTVLDSGDTIQADAYVAPNGITTADIIVSDTTSGPHGIAQQVSGLTQGARYIYSVYAKAANKTWLYMADQTSSDADGYFNLSTAAKGTMGSGITESFCEDWGNGWVRCVLSFSAGSTTDTFVLQPADGDLDATYSGNQGDVVLWGAQLTRSDCQGSYVPTTTATASKSGDRVLFKMDDGNMGGVGSNKQGCIVFDWLGVEFNNTIGASAFAIFSFNDGSATADEIHLDGVASAEGMQLNIKAANVAQNAVTDGTSDIWNGVKKQISVSWAIGEMSIRVDGVQVDSDTATDIPDNIDRLEICNGIAGGTTAATGVVANWRVYPYFRRR